MRHVFKWLLGGSRRRCSARKLLSGARPCVERLEDRELLAFDLNLTRLPTVQLRTVVDVSVDSGAQTLVINGTVFDDNVRVEYQPASGFNSTFVVRQDGREVSRVREYNNFYTTQGVLVLALRQVGRISFYGSNGNDRVENATAFPSTLNGGSGDDLVVGGIGTDTLYGELGNDTLLGQDGDDIIYGGDGNDLLDGGWGADVLWGMNGNDVLRGNSGNDKLYGDLGNDSLYGEDHDDLLFAGDGEDLLIGGNGRDVLLGDAGRDSLYGGNDADSLQGGDGNDMLSGEAGADLLEGQGGHDDLYGGLDNDTLRGGAGIDYLNTGGGSDVLDSGESAYNVAYGGGVRVVTTSKLTGNEDPLTLAEDKDLFVRTYKQAMSWAALVLPGAINNAVAGMQVGGEQIYGVSVSQLAPQEFTLDISPNGGPRLTLRLPNNVVTFRTTQPTFLGSWADPVFSAQFSVTLEVQLAPTAPLRVESTSVSAHVFLVASHNTLGDLAMFVVRFLQLLQPQTLEKTIDREIQTQLMTIRPQLEARLQQAALDVGNWVRTVSRRLDDFTLAFDPEKGQIVFRFPSIDP